MSRQAQTFTEQDTLVIQCMAMRLTNDESLRWISGHGHAISQSTLTRTKDRVRTNSEKRKHMAMAEGLLTQHFERIDQLETILKLSWENYHRVLSGMNDAKENKAKAYSVSTAQRILESIASIQPLLSRYYETTQGVIEFDKNNKPRLEITNHVKESRSTVQRTDRNIVLATNDIRTES